MIGYKARAVLLVVAIALTGTGGALLSLSPVLGAMLLVVGGGLMGVLAAT